MVVSRFTIFLSFLTVVSCGRPAPQPPTQRVLWAGRFQSINDLQVVPWPRPAERDGSKEAMLAGPGRVDIDFPTGEHFGMDVEKIFFHQHMGRMFYVTVTLPEMDKYEVYATLDRLTTELGIDKAKLGQWYTVCNDRFEAQGFILQRFGKDYAVDLGIGPTFDEAKPFSVHCTYTWDVTDEERVD